MVEDDEDAAMAYGDDTAGGLLHSVATGDVLMSSDVVGAEAMRWYEQLRAVQLSFDISTLRFVTPPR